MTSFLASAEQTDLSGSGWFVILIGATVIVTVAVVTVIPIVIARRRCHRWAEAVTVAAIFWGLLAAASIINFWLAELRWSKEFLLLLKTGYFDPGDASGAPPWPWRSWGVLAVAYGVLAALSLFPKRPPAPSPK